MVSENTIFFKVEKEKKSNSKQILRQVYEALVEKGYNPINQLVDIFYQAIQHTLQVITMQETK